MATAVCWPCRQRLAAPGRSRRATLDISVAPSSRPRPPRALPLALRTLCGCGADRGDASDEPCPRCGLSGETTRWEPAYRATGNQLAFAAFLLVVLLGTIGLVVGVLLNTVRPRVDAVEGALLGALVGAIGGLAAFVGGWRRKRLERHHYVCAVFDPAERAEIVSVVADAHVKPDGSVETAHGRWVERAPAPPPASTDELPGAHIDALRVIAELERAGVLLVPWLRARTWRLDGVLREKAAPGYREGMAAHIEALEDETACRLHLRTDAFEQLPLALQQCTDLPIPREEDGVEDGPTLADIVTLLREDGRLRSALLAGIPADDGPLRADHLARLYALELASRTRPGHAPQHP